MARKKAAKITPADLETYAIVRCNSVLWPIALALATPAERRCYEKIGVIQLERASEKWQRVARHARELNLI